MMTRRLWGALRSPARENPIWERGLLQKPPTLRIIRWLNAILEITSPLIQVVVMIFSPLLLPLAGNLYGLTLAVTISDAIGRERQHHTYDLLALMPPGIGRASWLICAATVERQQIVSRINTLRALSVAILIITALATLGSIPSGFVYSALLLIGLSVDCIQSVIIGCLSGLLSQLCAPDLFSMRLWAIGIFLGEQILLAYIAAFALVYLLAQWFAIQERTVVLGLYALLLAVIREGVIQTMWRALEQYLQ